MGAVRIAYQGMEGSNSEEASRLFVERLGIEGYEYVPLVSSKNVVESLLSGECQLGVVAVKNSLGGRVEESHRALKELKYQVLSRLALRIHHSLFVKNSEVKAEDIKVVASHVQALAQCKENLNRLLGQARTQEIEDTAIGAFRLAQGLLDRNTAVLCRLNAGQDQGLHLLYENIEDREDNITDFIIFTL